MIPQGRLLPVEAQILEETKVSGSILLNISLRCMLPEPCLHLLESTEKDRKNRSKVTLFENF